MQLHLYIQDLVGQSNSLTFGLFEGTELIGISMGHIKHWYTGTEYFIDEARDESYRLVSDCSRCSGLCCIALYCFKSDGFPQNKPIGKPCINLMGDYKCRIHNDLESMGMKGCIGYDCFGAGQYLTEEVYRGVTWQTQPERVKEICDLYIFMYRMFQLRFFLYESKKLVSSETLLPEINQLLQENDAMCRLPVEELYEQPIDSYQAKVNHILKKSCVELSKFIGAGNSKETNFLNRNFKGKDLSGFDFNMKPLIASNFENCKFKGATFIGTDTRDANFNGADLREAVFLSQGQINAAKGSRRTKLPKHLKYPVTWR